jgi:hypothetical protein
MLLLLGIRLRIITAINLSAYKENLQPFVIIDFFFQGIGRHYISILDKLDLQTLNVRRGYIDALFLINVF